MKILFVLIAAGFFYLCYRLLYLKGARWSLRDKRERVFFLIEGKVPNLEWLVRGLFAWVERENRYEPVFVDHGQAEESLIIERMSRQYDFALLKELPKNARLVTVLDGRSSVKSLREQITGLRTVAGEEKEREKRKAAQ